MIGLALQLELFEILVHFRTYPIAFSADISKMCRQIEIHLDNRFDGDVAL